MLRNLVLLLALPLFISSCSKNSDSGSNNSNSPNQFVINGIHDINLNSSTTSNLLPINIVTTKGAQEQVTLSVTGLPAGIYTTIDPASGTPTFGSMITFVQNGFTKGGAYPIKIVGTAASYTKSYDLTLNVPGSDFTLSGDDRINLDSFSNVYINVSQASGVKEPVTLTVSGLPTGLSAKLGTPIGTPDFFCNISLIETNPVAAGTYTMQITATSAHGTSTKDVTIIANKFSGYSVDGMYIRAVLTHKSSPTSSTFELLQPIHGGGAWADITGYHYSSSSAFDGEWPTADGTYTYTANDGRTNRATSVQISGLGGYESTASNPQTITLKIMNGKFSVSLPATVLNGGTGSNTQTKTVSIEASEQ